MANPGIKRVGAMLAGIVVAGLVVAVVESLGHLVFPPPAGFDLTKPEDQARLMEVLPLGAKLAVVGAWFLGALAGAWTALRLGAFPLAAWVVAVVMVALSVITTQMFPHPLWMVAAALLLPPLAAWLVLRWSAGGQAG
jgi:predicted naringenin-chalcone synthase